MSSEQRMVRRTGFPDVFLLPCSVQTVSLHSVSTSVYVLVQAKQLNSFWWQREPSPTPLSCALSPLLHVWGYLWLCRVDIHSVSHCINLCLKSCKVLGRRNTIKSSATMLRRRRTLALSLFSPHTLLFWKDVHIIYIEWIYNLWSLAERNRMPVFSAWQSALVQQQCCWTSLQAAFNGFSDNNRRLRRGSEMRWDKSQSAYFWLLSVYFTNGCFCQWFLLWGGGHCVLICMRQIRSVKYFHWSCFHCSNSVLLYLLSSLSWHRL